MKQHRTVERRKDEFARRPVTRIWEEQPSEDNPYVAESCRCRGYDLMELMEKRSFVDTLFLLFRDELPSLEQAELLETLMIGLISPGPRHPAARAAMTAGVGKTDTAHILPISLSVLGGGHLGGAEVEAGMRFLRKERKKDPSRLAEELIEQSRPPEGDWHPAPGFGSRFGGIDHIPGRIAARLASLPGAGASLAWGSSFAETLNSRGMGWLATGVAAAAFADLGFHPRAGAGLYQLVSAPGLLAQGLEFANKPLTAMPFPADEDYSIEDA